MRPSLAFLTIAHHIWPLFLYIHEHTEQPSGFAQVVADCNPPMPNYPPMPRLGESIEPPHIDVSSPEEHRTSFHATNFDSILPLLRGRFPNIEPLYLTKIFRGTIKATGLIWLDVDRQDTSPLDFSDFEHLLYCFEIYGQIVCILASPQGLELELELQNALADYRIRLLKLSKWATFESVLEWHKAVLEAQLQYGQDRPEGWRERREELGTLLRKKM